MTLKNVRYYMMQRMHYVASMLPYVNRLGDKVFLLIPVLTTTVWGCILACMIAWWARYGPGLKHLNGLKVSSGGDEGKHDKSNSMHPVGCSMAS